jgi:MFS family permease
MSRSFVSILLPVYAKEEFGLDERYYGFIAGTNGAMVVLFQYATTRLASKFPAQSVLALGSFFYAAGVGSVFFGSNFSGFLISMIVVTLGEMLILPTSAGVVANWAPSDMRGRYLSWLSLARDVGYGVGPVIGGVLNDFITPKAIWIGGGFIGFIAVAGFLALAQRDRKINPSDLSGIP